MMKSTSIHSTEIDTEAIVDNILEMIRPILTNEINRAIESQVRPIVSAAKELVDDEGRLAYSVSEAAETLSISTSKMNEMLYAGIIASVKMDRRRIIPREVLIEWLRTESAKELEYIKKLYEEGHGLRRDRGESPR